MSRRVLRVRLRAPQITSEFTKSIRMSRDAALASPRLPIVIPNRIRADRHACIRMGEWKTLMLKCEKLQKRVHWSTLASEIEKSRRRRRWQVIAKILEIENEMLVMLAQETEHPDLYSPSDSDLPQSRRSALLIKYHEATQRAKSAHGNTTISTAQARKIHQNARGKYVAEIRALEREWIVALYQCLHPGVFIPAPLVLHPTELRPRKVVRALRALRTEDID